MRLEPFAADGPVSQRRRRNQCRLFNAEHAHLKVGGRVGLGRGVIALECALEGAASVVGALGLLCGAGGSVSSAEALEVVLVDLLPLLVAETPEEHAGNSKHDGTADTHADTNDDVFVLRLRLLVAGAAAGGN